MSGFVPSLPRRSSLRSLSAFPTLARSEVEAKDRAGRSILDAEGNPTFNTVPVGDVDRFMKIAEALSARWSTEASPI